MNEPTLDQLKRDHAAAWARIGILTLEIGDLVLKARELWTAILARIARDLIRPSEED